MMSSWKQILTSKFFWLNLIGVLIQIGQYIMGQNLWPEYSNLLTVILTCLQIVSNAIAGTVQSQQVAKLKAVNTALKEYNTSLHKQLNLANTRLK